jgi:hypothetical protein
MSIRDTTKNLRRLRNRATQNPLAYFCPTPPQEAWLRDPSKIKLLLGGNQVGVWGPWIISEGPRPDYRKNLRSDRRAAL